MPTYDYICTNCSHEFEEFQKMSDPLLEECPKCKGSLQRKIGSGAGLLFKGSGFYITDYKKDAGSKNNSGKNTQTKKVENTKKPTKTDKA